MPQIPVRAASGIRAAGRRGDRRRPGPPRSGVRSTAQPSATPGSRIYVGSDSRLGGPGHALATSSVRPSPSTGELAARRCPLHRINNSYGGAISTGLDAAPPTSTTDSGMAYGYARSRRAADPSPRHGFVARPLKPLFFPLFDPPPVATMYAPLYYKRGPLAIGEGDGPIDP